MTSRIGVLLINTGTPELCTYRSVKSYLTQFLMDKRIIELPFFFRFVLVRFFITPFRALASAKKYREIWQENGSPLQIICDGQRSSLSQMLGDSFETVYAARYGKPCIKSQIEHLVEKDCEQIILVPMFPQYSSAASGSALEEAFACLKSFRHIPAVKTVSPFFSEQFFIDAHARLIRSRLSPNEHLIVSFHGLPKTHIEHSHRDAPCSQELPCPKNKTPSVCYRAQCFETARLIAEKLGLSPDCYSVCFQSRLGNQEWIQPYLENTLVSLRKNGIENITVVSPAFVSDCLETIHEIGIEAKATWRKLGGTNFKLIPCLNLDEQWLTGLRDKIKQIAGIEIS